MKSPKNPFDKTSDAEKELTKKVSSVLDQEAEALPAHIQVRLNVARNAALNFKQDKSSREFFGFLSNNSWAVGVTAFAAMFVVVVAVVFNSSSSLDDSSQLVDELNLVVVNEDLPLLQEDLEFYVWLQEQDVSDLDDSSKNSG